MPSEEGVSENPVEKPVVVPDAVPGHGNLKPGKLNKWQYRDDRGVIRTIPEEDRGPKKVKLTDRQDAIDAVIEWVVTRPPEQDETHQQKFYRELKDRNPIEFAKRLADLEERKRSTERHHSVENATLDVGSEKAMAMIDQLLTEATDDSHEGRESGGGTTGPTAPPLASRGAPGVPAGTIADDAAEV